MKKSYLRFILYTIIIYLAGGTFNSAVAASPPSWGNGMHFCGVIDDQFDKRDSDQFPNRNYARQFTANLNVGEPRTVRLIYFLPNDRPYREDVVQRMKEEILNIQTFYAESIKAHGYDMTFKIETDEQAEPVVHRVDGQHPNSHYIGGKEYKMTDEVQQKFDVTQNIYFIVLDNHTDSVGLVGFGGVGGGGGRQGKSGGFGWVRDNFNWTTGAHELGHAFGLQHDFRSGGYIMSYGAGRNRAPIDGPDQDSLSVCNADFLAAHPYFNSDIPPESGQPPTIELTSPYTYPTGSESVDIQLKITDSEGIHQVILFVRTTGPNFLTPVGFPEVKICRKLAGEKVAVIDLEYDGDVPSSLFTNLARYTTHDIFIAAIDIGGDVRYSSFTLSEDLPDQPPPIPKTLVKISGDNQQGTSGTILPNPLIVEVRDLSANPLPNIVVKFTVITGSETLGKRFATENVMTNAHGQAELIHTLSTSPGDNIVEVAVSGGEPVTFHAIGIGTSTVSQMDDNYQTWGAHAGITILGKGGIGEMEDAVAFSPDGQYLAVSSKIGIWLYDATTYQEIGLLFNTDKVSALAFSHDGTLLSGIASNIVSAGDNGSAKSQRIHLWDVERKKKVDTFGKGNRALEFSPNGRIIASGYFTSVYLWNVETQQEIVRFSHEDFVNSISFSPNGNLLASGSRDNIIKLWNVTTGQNIATFTHKSSVYSVEFSPDGKTLASASYDSTIKLWDIATGTESITIQRRYPVTDVTFSPDGKTLAWTSDGIILWEVATLTRIVSFEGGGSSIAFSPDGKSLVSVSDYGSSVKIWDIETGNTIELEHTRHKYSERTINAPADFFLPLKEGSHLIHIPLKVTTVNGIPQTIETIGDLYDALGGSQNVRSLATRNSSNFWQYDIYSGASDAGTLADKKLTDDMGIMAHMSSPITLVLQGDALGTNGRSSITLHGLNIEDSNVIYPPPPNLIGIPLKDPRIQKVSDLFSLDGIRDNVTSITIEDNGTYKDITGVDDPDDILITGGQAFTLYARKSAIITICGEKWTNERPTFAAPSIVSAINHVETSLLPNYPNPFNPETWIPFRLAEDVDVTLTIYDVSGCVIRTLDIGYSKAGAYESRDKAIYWDGRNDLGEDVASGVYFYTLTAGEYFATRKMLILK